MEWNIIEYKYRANMKQNEYGNKYSVRYKIPPQMRRAAATSPPATTAERGRELWMEEEEREGGDKMGG